MDETKSMMMDAEQSEKPVPYRRGAMTGCRPRQGRTERVQTSVWLEPEDRDKLQAMAKVAKISMAEAMEKLVRREWTRRERRMLEEKRAA